MRIAIVEDDQTYAEYIKTLILQFDSRRDWIINIFSGSEQLLFGYDEGPAPFSLIFLDIELEHENGIDTGIKIHDLDPKAAVIFITGHIRYSYMAYEAHPYHFLLKPVCSRKFHKVLADICKRLKSVEDEFLYLPSKNHACTLPLSDILYIESTNHNVIIHTHTGSFRHSASMGEIEDMISRKGHWFCRTHRCMVVNMKHVVLIDRSERTLILRTGIKLPIAKRRIKAAAEKYREVQRIGT